MEKIIPFAPSYSISDTGEITRIIDCDNASAGRILRQWIGSGGYRRVRLSVDGKTQLWAVHRLLCWVFYGPPPPDRPFACHRDGNKLNNIVRNLRWDTAQANSDDKLTHGTMPFGERAGPAKLTTEQVEAVLAAPRQYGTGRALARRYGVSPLTISRIRCGKMRKHG